MANDEQDTRQSDTDPDEADVTSSEGDDQGSPDQSSDGDEALTLKELEDQLGRDFPNKEAAMKSLKDTFGYVGDLGSKVAQYEERYGELDDSDSVDDTSDSSTEDDDVMTKSEYRKEKFFDENPQYQDHREVIEALGEKHDAEPQEVVEMEGVKSLFEGQADSNQNQESVAMSNNRVGQTTEAMDDANQQLQEANQATVQGDVTKAQRKRQEAQKSAVQAVADIAEDE